MNIGTNAISTGNSMAGLSQGRFCVPVDELELRHLSTREEIEEILYLRENIDLSVHTAAGGDFEALEKKETNAGLWERSGFEERPSAPSGSCRWIAA